ncbi:hypothetical protein P3T23_002302 [Paraburkholderia sp. GAS448]
MSSLAKRGFGVGAQSMESGRRRLQLRQHAAFESEPALQALHNDFIVLPEHTLDRHALTQALHKWRMVAKVVQHRTGIGLHKRARDSVICVADVIEMRERVRAEAIENFLVEYPHEIAVDAHELQFARGRDERAGRVALRMNASHETAGCERSEKQSSHLFF